jgi:hypothetical protein
MLKTTHRELEVVQEELVSSRQACCLQVGLKVGRGSLIEDLCAMTGQRKTIWNILKKSQ